jgi:hypothetical protein
MSGGENMKALLRARMSLQTNTVETYAHHSLASNHVSDGSTSKSLSD